MSKIFELTEKDFEGLWMACKFNGYTPIRAIDKLLTIKKIEHKNLDVKVHHPRGLNGRQETQYQFYYIDKENKEVNVLADKRGFRITTNFYNID